MKRTQNAQHTAEGMPIRHSDILPLVKARAQNYPSDLLLEQELDHDSSNKSCQEKKRYQATRPPRRRAVFFLGFLYFWAARRDSKAPPAECRWSLALAPTGATDPSGRAGLSAPRTGGIVCFLRRAYYLARMRSMRRNGSAAPHSNWSPTVKAER